MPPSCPRPVRLVITLLAAVLLAACDGDGTRPATPEAPAGPTPTRTQTPAASTPDDGPTPAPGPTDTPVDADEPDLAAASVRLTEVASVDSPTAAVPAPGGGLFVTERGGRLLLLDLDGGSTEVLLDLSDATTTDVERGLLGVAVDADAAQLYLSYTGPDGESRLDAYELDDGLPVDGSQRRLLEVEQPFANHNGGHIVIGPDGMLWFGLGDGGSAGDPLDAGQDTSLLLGSLLRIDPLGGDPYAIPADNPFVHDPDARDEIWAYGLRNPWRFSFDAATGDLWIADVGQAEREEVNVMPAGQGAGANYGWNRMEGTLPFAGEEPDDHVPPVFEYELGGGRCAITGGFVYRGEAIPALRGAYLFSDYCDGAIHALHVRDREVVDVVDLGIGGGSVVSFAQDADRELYVADLDGGVYRIEPD